MPSGPVLVVRLSSLGDVILAGHLPSLLRAARPGRRVLFLTKERFAEVLRNHPDIDRFYVLEDGSSDPAAPAPLGVKGSAGDLLAALRREGVDETVDLQQNLRSSRLTAALGGARGVPFQKHGFRRRLLVHARWLRPAPLEPLLRRYRSLAGLPPDAPLRPWLRDSLTDAERGRAAGRAVEDDGGEFIALAVGARWGTKRWPIRHFLALAEQVEKEAGLRARFLVAPGEREITRELESQPLPRRADVLSLGVRDAAAVAAGARAIVSNDSALLHLGPALGVPSLGIFGSTVPAFGFASGEANDAIAELALACRPCDVHGKRRCPLGHHACMERLEPAAVFDRLRPLLDGTPR